MFVKNVIVRAFTKLASEALCGAITLIALIALLDKTYWKKESRDVIHYAYKKIPDSKTETMDSE